VFALGLAGPLDLFITIVVLLAGYLSVLCVSYAICAFIYGRRRALRGDGSVVVVLGAGLQNGGEVGPLLASRLQRGLSVYQVLTARSAANPAANPADDPVLVVSGGKGADERVSEAQAMAGYLTGRGFPAARLILEDRSRTTEENLLFSKAIMDERRPGARWVIVTSSFHALRAAIIARRLGIDGQVTGAPTPGYAWPGGVLREFAAVFVRYKVVTFGGCALIVVAAVADALS
jgi:uncharacterized SAM-binding protein YcdF (DUF218 family)